MNQNEFNKANIVDKVCAIRNKEITLDELVRNDYIYLIDSKQVKDAMLVSYGLRVCNNKELLEWALVEADMAGCASWHTNGVNYARCISNPELFKSEPFLRKTRFNQYLGRMLSKYTPGLNNCIRLASQYIDLNFLMRSVNIYDPILLLRYYPHVVINEQYPLMILSTAGIPSFDQKYRIRKAYEDIVLKEALDLPDNSNRLKMLEVRWEDLCDRLGMQDESIDTENFDAVSLEELPENWHMCMSRPELLNLLIKRPEMLTAIDPDKLSPNMLISLEKSIPDIQDYVDVDRCAGILLRHYMGSSPILANSTQMTSI